MKRISKHIEVTTVVTLSTIEFWEGSKVDTSHSLKCDVVPSEPQKHHPVLNLRKLTLCGKHKRALGVAKLWHSEPLSYTVSEYKVL
jgi:hypothetical protein